MSSEPKWTPGPWIAKREYANLWRIEEATGSNETAPFSIAVVTTTVLGVGSTDSATGANAQIIAASPKLYEALYQVLTVANLRDHPAIAEMARTALASARGEG